MQDLKERAAYLRGLVEGSDVAQNEKARLIWDGLLDFCEQIADSVEAMEDSHGELADYIEAIDKDLDSLEKYFYTDDDEENDTDVMLSGSEDMVEMTCPHCREELIFDDEPGEYEVVCPECGQVIWSHFTVDERTERKSADVI